ncbi:hypothetical protein PCASD_08910 [Puccinia coronata f. sp. avenae]|uniref:Gamma-glutamyltransferase n=1 Tax=Puccinia coronata f. sp. avenae TaxID=200324 RepID=A0A2N5UUC2_9BASI|nr:hypothetical protein PCASD_08910 [Puccinia coronata f. sp. avenae]
MVIKPPPTSPQCQQSGPGHTSCSPITINFRETIPNGELYFKSFKLNSKTSETGGMAIGIPGELAGYHAAYERFGGGVSWKRIFEPSIQLAKNFSVGSILASKLSTEDVQSWIKTKPEWLRTFQPQYPQLTRSGDWIQRPHYSQTLKTIAEQGIQPFYHGQIAQQLVKTINREGGKVSIRDFQTYEPVVDRAINTTYHGYNVWTVGPPSSGVMLLHILNVLERFSLHEHPRTSLSEHRFVEALKFAGAARTELGDPRFMNKTQLARIDQIISKEYGQSISKRIDDNHTHDYSYYQPKYDLVQDHGTTHMSVVDRFGSAVSLTSTVNLYFGSTVMDPDNGIILNDQNDDFSVPGKANAFQLFSSPLNYPVTGKRPLSSMAPIIVDYLHPQQQQQQQQQQEGQPIINTIQHLPLAHPQAEFFCALGASGGSRIYGAVAGTFLKLLWGYDISHAIEDPRIHHQLLPNELSVEKGYEEIYLAGLRARGHNITIIPDAKSVVNGIYKRIADDTLYASSDSRKNGVPAAY